MSAATKVIKQVASGQVTGQTIKKRADAIVAASTVTANSCPAATTRPLRQP
ncbi:MAG: hypothetical protein ACM3ZC_11965 [Bacteroidota bacterium]